MPVGTVIGSGQVDNIITSLAVDLRNVMQQISNLNRAVNGQGAGLAYLERLGYSAAPDAGNPGGVSNAELALSMISYLNTVAAVYFGAAAQADAFNFDQELSQVWAGQIGP